MSLSIKEQAARALGMKVREVTEVEDHGHYAVVTTHDGTRTVLVDDGTIAPYTPEFVAALGDRPAEPAAQDAEDEKPGDGDESAGEDEVPAGTVEVVLAWVGQDVDRAQRALDAELATDKPRTGLVSTLQKVVEA